MLDLTCVFRLFSLCRRAAALSWLNLANFHRLLADVLITALLIVLMVVDLSQPLANLASAVAIDSSFYVFFRHLFEVRPMRLLLCRSMAPLWDAAARARLRGLLAFGPRTATAALLATGAPHCFGVVMPPSRTRPWWAA